MYLKTPNAPGQRVFLRCTASFFLEIRQYSCEKMSCSTQEFLAAGHIMRFQIHPQKCNNLSFADSRCGRFELRFRYVLERCTASAHHPSSLVNKAVPCWDTFSVPCQLCGLLRMLCPTTISYRPILSAAIMLRTFLRLWGVIVVLRLREFEIRIFQICGGKNFKVLSRIQKPDKKIPVISHKK